MWERGLMNASNNLCGFLRYFKKQLSESLQWKCKQTSESLQWKYQILQRQTHRIFDWEFVILKIRIVHNKILDPNTNMENRLHELAKATHLSDPLSDHLLKDLDELTHNYQSSN